MQLLNELRNSQNQLHMRKNILILVHESRPLRHINTKALLTLIQNSNTLQSHSVNYLTIWTPNLGACIICNIPNMPRFGSSILNVGAINHVCYSNKFFQCLKIIKHAILKFPNDCITSSHFAWTILFDQNLYLNDVLYVPIIFSISLMCLNLHKICNAN